MPHYHQQDHPNSTSIYLSLLLYSPCLHRQKDLTGAQPDTLTDLEDYAEDGHSSVLYLLLEALGVRDQESEYAASHIGVCSGITTILRGFPHHAANVSTCLSACLSALSVIIIVYILPSF